MRNRAARAAPLALAAFVACAPVYAEGGGSGTGPAPRPIAEMEVAAGATAAADAALAVVLGRLVWPLRMDRASVLSSAYGDRRHPTGGDVRFHHGLDLRADEGAPVFAVADGQVVTAGERGAYGHHVVIDHGADLRSLYAHASRLLVAPGDRVARGDVVALVGHTGNATGDHLHFELRWRDGFVDPWRVLPPLARSGR